MPTARDVAGDRLDLLAGAPVVQTFNEEALGAAGSRKHRVGHREHGVGVHDKR